MIGDNELEMIVDEMVASDNSAELVSTLELVFFGFCV